MRFYQCKIAVFLVGVLSFAVNAQESQLNLIKTIPVTAQMIEVDNVGNIYTIKDGEISKYDSDGNFVMKNSAMAFGEITSLDATNALKMVLFFKDLSQITYMDNQLSSRGDRIELDVFGYFQTTAVCRSYNNGLWIYDQTTFELTRFTEQFEISAQSGNLAQVIGEVPSPNYMREFNNWLYVNDEQQGILVFDWYASYTKTIPIKGVKKFVVRAGKLFFIKESTLESFDLTTSNFAEIKLPTTNVVDFSLFENRLLIITKNQLLIYGINVE